MVFCTALTAGLCEFGSVRTVLCEVASLIAATTFDVVQIGWLGALRSFVVWRSTVATGKFATFALLGAITSTMAKLRAVDALDLDTLDNDALLFAALGDMAHLYRSSVYCIA